MEADEETLAKIEASTPAKPAPVEQTPAAPAPVTPEPAAVDPAPVASSIATEESNPATPEVVAPVAEAAPKKKARPSKKSSEEVSQDTAATVVASSVGDIQSLVDAAIAEAAVLTQAEEDATSQATFATDFLLTSTMKGRRRPGPSLTGFMDMASTMKRR